ncbi:hypothetical protein [Thalassotalea maritima]|uniref:hypothetical protein n=1 Tax=Thalassotalea maritima TaxID=3242416 RepID=UPI003526ED3F
MRAINTINRASKSTQPSDNTGYVQRRSRKKWLTSILATLAFTTSFTHAKDDVQLKMEIVNDNSDYAQVIVVENGNTQNFEIPKDAIHDEEQLRAAVADLSKETQDLLIRTLTNMPVLEEVDGKKVMLMGKHKHVIKQGEEGEAFAWTSQLGDVDNVMVIDIDTDGDTAKAKKFIKHINADKNFVVKFADNGSPVAAITNILEHGTFTTEQLDEIQQALDKKR